MNNKKVRKSIGDGTADFQQLLLNIQDANDVTTHALTNGGYNGNALKRTIVEIPTLEKITEEHSKEQYDVLMKANTHGKLFSALGGYHLTSDDIFISAEMKTREKEKKRLTIEKNKRLQQMKVEEKAKLVLDTKGNDCTSWTRTDFDAVLAWYNPPKRTQLTTNEEKARVWNDILTKNKAPPVYERWTDDDERALLEASKDEIAVSDTTLGWVQRRKRNEVRRSIMNMTDAEWAEAVAARENSCNLSQDTTADGEVGEV